MKFTAILMTQLQTVAQWQILSCAVNYCSHVGTSRAGPSRCGAQCKTEARGPSEQCFMTSSCSVNRATTFLRKWPICRATIPSLFLRFALILQYYVLENI